jgi:hypothetical protein
LVKIEEEGREKGGKRGKLVFKTFTTIFLDFGW